MAKTLSVGIIGAGPGGPALGILLRKAGFDDFTIFDREDGVGGAPGGSTSIRGWRVTSRNHRAVTPSSWSVTLQTSEEVSR